MFHNGGPRTVPWYTMLQIFIYLENFPPTATRDLRSYNQDCITSKIASGTPRARSFRKSRLELTLSKAPDTSEQYTAILRCLLIVEIHVNTSCAKASRAPRSGIYANWFRPYAPVQISCRTNKEAMNLSATLLICDVRWMPL